MCDSVTCKFVHTLALCKSGCCAEPWLGIDMPDHVSWNFHWILVTIAPVKAWMLCWALNRIVTVGTYKCCHAVLPDMCGKRFHTNWGCWCFQLHHCWKMLLQELQGYTSSNQALHVWFSYHVNGAVLCWKQWAHAWLWNWDFQFQEEILLWWFVQCMFYAHFGAYTSLLRRWEAPNRGEDLVAPNVLFGRSLPSTSIYPCRSFVAAMDWPHFGPHRWNTIWHGWRWHGAGPQQAQDVRQNSQTAEEAETQGGRQSRWRSGCPFPHGHVWDDQGRHRWAVQFWVYCMWGKTWLMCSAGGYVCECCMFLQHDLKSMFSDYCHECKVITSVMQICQASWQVWLRTKRISLTVEECKCCKVSVHHFGAIHQVVGSVPPVTCNFTFWRHR